MEPTISDNQATPAQNVETKKTYVYTIRDWKEYLGESLLIIFSVLLALILSEYINNLHEKETTRSIMKSIVAELKQNKTSLQEMNQYNLQVLNNIDSVIVNKKLQQQLVSDDAFKLKVIAPEGALYRYLNNEAWTIAKNNNIMSKVDIETLSILTKVYEDQSRVMKVEDEVAKVILSRDSRDPGKIHATLVILQDIYHAWSVDRNEGLLHRIDDAIKKVEDY